MKFINENSHGRVKISSILNRSLQELRDLAPIMNILSQLNPVYALPFYSLLKRSLEELRDLAPITNLNEKFIIVSKRAN
jgi:hypothetical protein